MLQDLPVIAARRKRYFEFDPAKNENAGFEAVAAKHQTRA